MCISNSMTEYMNKDRSISSRGASFTCIYGWDPRFRSVFVLTRVMDRPKWSIGALLGKFTAERVGARHNDPLAKWSS